MDDKLSLKRAWSGHGNHLHFGRHQPYLQNGWSLNRQILHAIRLYQILSYGDKAALKGAWSKSRDTFFKIFPNHIFVISEAWHFKFRVLIKSEEYGYYCQMRCVQSHVTSLNFWK